MQESPTQRNRILIVDDDPDVISSLGRLLRLEGYEIHSCNSIAEILEREDWSRFLALILDRQLPDGKIEEALPKIREMVPEAAVIIATGFADVEGTIAAFREQVEDYLIKPVHPDYLKARLKKVAERLVEKDRITQLESDIANTLEREQQEIALELQDGLCSNLGGIGLLLNQLAQNLEQQGNSAAAQTAMEIQKLSQNSLTQARRLSHSLYPFSEGPNCLIDALKRLVSDLSVQYPQTKITFVSQPSSLAIEDALVVNHLYRISQEALAQAIRNGNCALAEIKLKQPTTNQTLLSISTKQCESEGKSSQAMTDRMIEYRADLIGANLTIEKNSPEAGGRCLKVELIG